MTNRNIDILVDMNFGSTGKGLAASYLSLVNHYDIVMSANMVNAGHTAYDPQGRKFVHKVLPSGVFNNPEHVMVGPGAIFDPSRLLDEYRNLRDFGHIKNTRVLIHENAVVLTPEMKAFEQNSAVTKIASTAQGAAMAMIAKIMRDPDNSPIARDVYIDLSETNIEIVTNGEWQSVVNNANKILAEGAQGYSLGINQKFYPFCTSRDCGPARFMSDMALPVKKLNEVIGVARTYPIRVGNTTVGYSGDWYPDQTELTWEQIGVPEETTTVTGRVRRVATFSMAQFDDALVEMSVGKVFMNFVNYLSRDHADKFLREAQDACRFRGADLAWVGMGPKADDVLAYEESTFETLGSQ